MEEPDAQEEFMGGLQPFSPSSNFLPRLITDFLDQILLIAGSTGDRASRIDDFVGRLQEEQRKISAFERELPLCVILMSGAIESLKEAADGVNSSLGEPMLEEFIPLRRCREEDGGQEAVKSQEETDLKDKKNWMSSVQLWNADDHQLRPSPQSPRLELQCKQKQERKETKALKDMVNGTVASRKGSEMQSNSGSGPALAPFVRMVSCGRLITGSAHAAPSSPQKLRKQRRCWAPELHRQFVDALEKLGGSQAATPKQIRELMQVDGLTNDEVKSHLQKYRLHTQKLPTIKDSSPSNPPAVLGDMWTKHKNKCSESSRPGSNSQSRSPRGPFQLASNKSITPFSRRVDCIKEDDENEKPGGNVA
ncbi:hypothetical protein SAY86_018754 [Trapa natans]|uniref:HTH myb-type domain-containing protein n=1 Tax=Trapa natans TaxID=22666 RepID=A0AAN7LNT5_TRANT|nr:hypothetical protein SAY86_018754 [Trapa natans]